MRRDHVECECYDIWTLYCKPFAPGPGCPRGVNYPCPRCQGVVVEKARPLPLVGMFDSGRSDLSVNAKTIVRGDRVVIVHPRQHGKTERLEGGGRDVS